MKTIKKDNPDNKSQSLNTQRLLRDSQVYTPDVHELVDTVMEKIMALYNEKWWNKNEISVDADTDELFQLLWKEYLRNLVLETYKKLSSFTAWQEGEVYKIDLWFKKLLLVKKRLRPGSSNEFELHKTVYEIAKNSDSWVKVPVPIDSFIDWENELILMEYINWKTLYNIVWQSIVKDVLFKKIERHTKNNRDWSLINNFNSYKEKYLIDWKIDFENDSICEEWVLELLFIMFQSWLIKENPWTITFDKWKKSYPVMEKIYKENFSKAMIFDTEEQKNDTVKKIRQFLDEIHKEWFYHRDLWWNPRNIMFEKIDNEYKVTIIDFWKSEKLSPWSKFSDFDQFSWGQYDNDNDVVLLLNSLEIEKEETTDVTTDITNNITWKANKVWLEITQDYLESNYDFLKNRNNTLKKLLNDLIDWKNKNHWSYIYFKNKLDEFESKSTEKWKKELFLMIQSLTKKEKTDLLSFISNYLKESKSSNKHKYAKLYYDYINA